MQRKVLIIGIDGGTWTILKPAIEQGYMPFLKSLCDTGAHGILQSTIPAITPAAWAAFQTGMNPGKTGAVDFFYWDIAERKKYPVSSHTLKNTIWEIASRHGKRVGVLNVPMTYPPKPINGYLVTGILTPSINSDFTYPPSLKSELLSAIPDYDILNMDKIRGYYRKRFFSAVDHLTKIIETRTKAGEFLLAKENFDVFMIHFQANDILQHKLWGYIEESAPAFDSQKKDYVQRRFYKTLDSCMQRIATKFSHWDNSNCLNIVASDHGLQLLNRIFNLGKWLNKEGYFSFQRKYAWYPYLKNICKTFDVFNIRTLIQWKLKAKTIQMLATEGPFSWEDSKVISTGSGDEGMIYILEGNSSKRLNIEKELSAKLLKIKDPYDGTVIVRKIYRKNEVFKGDFFNFMPDLILDPAPNYRIANFYRAGGRLFTKTKPKGKHHREGILVVSGHGVKPAGNLNVHITDVAPTVLYYLGLPVNKNFDGNVFTDLFTSDFLRENAVIEAKQADQSCSGSEMRDIYSQQDKEQIKRRLEDLGYI